MFIRSGINGDISDGKKQWEQNVGVGGNNGRPCNRSIAVLGQWGSICSGSVGTERELARAVDASLQCLRCLLSSHDCCHCPLRHWFHRLSLPRSTLCSQTPLLQVQLDIYIYILINVLSIYYLCSVVNVNHG